MNVTSANIKEFLAENGLAVLKFTAEWCSPCKAMKPVLAAVQAETPGLVVGEIDIETSPELAVEYGVQTIPQLRLFKDGKEIGKGTGATSKEKLKTWIDTCVQKAAA